MTEPIALVGLDIAKSIFQVHAADKHGRPIFRRKLKRDEVEPYFGKLPPCQIGIEACPGSHHWARVLRRFGRALRRLTVSENRMGPLRYTESQTLPGQGFCLYYKVLEKGRFPWPARGDGAVRLTSAQLAMLCEGVQEYPVQ